MTLSSDVDVLVIEDDEPKLKAILQFFQESFPALRIAEVRSLSSAIGALGSCRPRFVVVDMSLPAYDFAKDPSGGSPQGFGGEDILRFVSDEAPGTPTVVLTQYGEFPDDAGGGLETIDQLEARLGELLGPRFGGVIYYENQHGDWRLRLRALVESALGGKSDA